MANNLPIRKFVKVKIKKRQNRREDSVSYALRWTEYGQRHSRSLGPYATRAYAERMRSELEQRLNQPMAYQDVKPIQWKTFVQDYLAQTYPGHDLPVEDRREAERNWKKSFGTMKRENLAIRAFERHCKPGWCHDLTTQHRDRFVAERLKEVGSAVTVYAELRALHTLCETMEEWGHRSKGDNPFAGRAKVEGRRRRQKKESQEKKVRHYTFEEVRALLNRATEEATSWETKRLRALVFFVAYTGCRSDEALYLEWTDIDFERGIAWLSHKRDNQLKTEKSAAPFGLPDKLISVLREWETEKACSWVFPNSRQKPWTGGAPGYRPFDQVQALGERCGIQGANLKRFRHSLVTHGKQRFGMSAEQVRAQVRHTTLETQKHYEQDDLANLRDAVKGVDFS
jgi:integrase